MVEDARKKEILQKLIEAVVEFNEDAAKEWSEVAINEGIDAYEAIMDGLAAGMGRVGELYDRQEYFVPEMLMCADALYCGLDILKAHINKATVKSLGTVVIGTVQGDIHDIGKNLVKLMFEVSGYQVVDLGHDVPPERFLEEQEKVNADIVALSAMMTTTMMGMKKVIKIIREKNPNVAIMIGGAPVNQQIATLFGADGYADSAGKAVQEAKNVLNNR